MGTTRHEPKPPGRIDRKERPLHHAKQMHAKGKRSEPATSDTADGCHQRRSKPPTRRSQPRSPAASEIRRCEEEPQVRGRNAHGVPVVADVRRALSDEY